MKKKEYLGIYIEIIDTLQKDILTVSDEYHSQDTIIKDEWSGDWGNEF